MNTKENKTIKRKVVASLILVFYAVLAGGSISINFGAIFKFILYAELFKVSVKIFVEESFKGAVLVNRIAFPFQVPTNIHRACLFIDSRFYVAFSVANLRPALVIRNSRRRIRVNHRRDFVRGVYLNHSKPSK